MGVWDTPPAGTRLTLDPFPPGLSRLLVRTRKQPWIPSCKDGHGGQQQPGFGAVFRTTDRTAKTWGLEPPGTNTFRIVMPCGPGKPQEIRGLDLKKEIKTFLMWLWNCLVYLSKWVQPSSFRMRFS